jgi:hypothetical protein
MVAAETFRIKDETDTEFPASAGLTHENTAYCGIFYPFRHKRLG